MFQRQGRQESKIVSSSPQGVAKQPAYRIKTFAMAEAEAIALSKICYT